MRTGTNEGAPEGRSPASALQQDAPAGAPRSDARPARPLDDRRLRSLFIDLLGRPPFAAEREEWLGQGTERLLDELLDSPAFWRHWFQEQLYYFLLIDNFRPAGETIQAVPELLADGRLSVRDALHRIALTPSFDLRNPGADTFVTVVMEQFCGITVQRSRRELEIGKAAYDGGEGLFLGSRASSQADVVAVAVEHQDASRHFVGREYQRLVGEPLARRDLVKTARKLHKDPWSYVEVVRGWLLSEAYAERLERGVELANRLFVRALFVDLLEREPSDDEAEALRGALDGLGDSRPLRAVVVRMLLDSGRVAIPAKESIEDPTAWIAGEFRRLLGRDASEEELRAFVTAFHEPDCRPRTILQVLLSDPSYHRY